MRARPSPHVACAFMRLSVSACPCARACIRAAGAAAAEVGTWAVGGQRSMWRLLGRTQHAYSAARCGWPGRARIIVHLITAHRPRRFHQSLSTSLSILLSFSARSRPFVHHLGFRAYGLGFRVVSIASALCCRSVPSVCTPPSSVSIVASSFPLLKPTVSHLFPPSISVVFRGLFATPPAGKGVAARSFFIASWLRCTGSSARLCRGAHRHALAHVSKGACCVSVRACVRAYLCVRVHVCVERYDTI